MNIKEFIEKSIAVHGNTYDYSKVKYIDNRTKVEIICPIHGSFFQVPYSHYSGCGCPQCYHTSRRTTLKTNELISKIRDLKSENKELKKIIKVLEKKRKPIKSPNSRHFFSFNTCKIDINENIDRNRKGIKCHRYYIYAILDDKYKNAYIGLTIDVQRRWLQHKNDFMKKRGTIYNFAKGNNFKFPDNITILESDISEWDAGTKEFQYCCYFKDKGYNLINVRETGVGYSSLGNICRVIKK